MTYKAALYGALAVLGLTAAGPAMAQPFWDMMPPRAVIGLVRASGFEPLSRPVLQGRHYVLRAVDPVGTSVRIVVDAEYGEIVSARPINGVARHYRPGVPVAVASPYGRGPRFANVPPDMEEMPAPSDYGARPNAGVSRRAPAAPVQGRTPLPRSRPMESAKAPQAAPEPAAETKSPGNDPSLEAGGPPRAAEQPAPTAATPAKPAAPAMPPVQPLEE